MYVAYQGDKKGMKKSEKIDLGGTLIACSEDGTISLTNLNSPEILQRMQTFSLRRNDREKKRADDAIKEKRVNQVLKRRHSFCSHVNLRRYFNLVKIEPSSVYRAIAGGKVENIVAV